MALTGKSLDKVRKSIPRVKGEMVRVNLEVEAQTRTRWKTAALERNSTLGEMIERAVNEYLSK